MFSRKMVVVIGVILLVTVNIGVLSITSRNRHAVHGIGRTVIVIVAPLQDAFSTVVRFLGDIWHHYFNLVLTAQENDRLKRQLNLALEKKTDFREVELSNERLRKLLDFKQSIDMNVVSAEVIGKDPSPWFKSVIIDKGRMDGVDIGFPVVVPQGIVGQVTDASSFYAKVLLVIDQNSAVDGLVQRTRARGIIKGAPGGGCIFKYVLRKHELEVMDTIVSSGLDSVFPKGLRIGQVASVVKHNSGIFQEVTVTPFADFEKIEEVLVILKPADPDLDMP